MVPVVFPDGSTAELVYPPRLRLAQLGVQPTVSVGIKQNQSGFRHERFLLISKSRFKKLRSDDPPIETYAGASGNVMVWRAKDPADFGSPVFMQFKIGTWNVIIGDGNAGDFMGRNNRRSWAESLDGYETENGFVVIEPRPPLSFATRTGPDLLLSTCFRFVELRLEDCRHLNDPKPAGNPARQTVRGVPVHRSKEGRLLYANWCTPSRQVSVYLNDDDKKYVDLAVRGLRIRHVDVREPPRSGE